MFYKNIANALAMYFYTLLARASGERLFLAIYLELFNVVYTAMPIIIFGIFDQDVPKSVSAASPQLYKPGLTKVLYTHHGFIRWMAEATALAAIVTYLPAFTLRVMREPDPTVDSLSFTTMFLVVICTNLRLVHEVHSWGILAHLALWGSLVAIELSCLVFSYVVYQAAWPLTYSWRGFYMITDVLYTSASWWLCMVLTIALVMLPRLIGKSLDTVDAAHVLDPVEHACNCLTGAPPSQRRTQHRCRDLSPRRRSLLPNIGPTG